MKVACYARVSTEEQNLDRQKQATTNYSEETFGIGLGDMVFYQDKSTGTNTERSGYESMMQDAENSEFDAVVVNSVSRISRSIRDLDRTAERLSTQGIELHIISESLVLRPDDDDPYQTAMFQLLGVFSELEAAITRQRVREGIAARKENGGYHHGRPPLGFEKQDGELYENEDYDRVCTVLEMVAGGNMSKRKAAKELDTSRRSIGRALDERSELYGL